MNNYLTKGFFVIENNTKQLSSLPNDAKQIIHVIEQLETDFFMAKNIATSSVENTINKLHIHTDLYFIYKQHFYYDKKDEMDEILY